VCDWVMIMRHIQIIIEHDNDCVDTNRTHVGLSHEYRHIQVGKKNKMTGH
jgi:hypothetical protein